MDSPARAEPQASPTGPVPRAGKPRAVLLAGLALVGVLAAGTLFLGALRVAAGEVVLAHTEGVNFASVERLADGGLRALYPAHPELSRPYLISPYTPLFYLEWAALRGLLRLPDSLTPGRLVALLALVACAVLLRALIRRSVGLDAVALLFSLAALASPFVIESAAIGITDVAGLAWSLLGLYLVGIGATAGRTIRPAIVPFALALLTKQSLAAGLLAATASLLLRGRRREAAELCGGALALALAAGAALDLVTAGGLGAATVGGLAQPVRWTQFAFLTPYLLKSWLVWPLAALSLAGLSTARSVSGWPRLAFLYGASAVGLALATIGKVGSSTNYFIEPMLALSWTAAVGFERLARIAPRLATTALVLLTAAALTAGPSLRERMRALADYRTLIAQADRELSAHDLGGWVLSGSDLFPIVERRGGVPYLNDSYLYGLFWESRRWPADGFLSDIACGRVRLVLPPVVPPRPAGARWGMYWENWSFWNSPVVVRPILGAYEAVPGPRERIVPILRPRSTAACPGGGEGDQPMSPASRKEK